MLKVSITLFELVVLKLSGEKNHRIGPSKKALIIGISRYDNLQSLDLCENDAEELSRVLGGLGYEILDNYKLIGYVTLEVMKKAIQQFFTGNRREDTLLFYYSGHGLPEGRDRYYLAPSDVDPNSLLYTGWSFDYLQYAIEDSNAAKRLAILDCCFSGAAGEGVKGADDISIAKIARDRIDKRMMESEGTYLLASSLAYQQSVIKKNLGHSLFTYYLLEGLKGIEGYRDSAGYVTADNLHDYVFDMMTEKEKIQQKPIRKAKVSGSIMVAHYPQYAKHEPEQIHASPSSSTDAQINAILRKGDRYYKEKKYTDAIRYYDQAINIAPKNHVIYIRKGDAFFDLGKDDEAIQAYKSAIDLSPEDPEAYDLVGDVYYRSEKYEQALKSYEKASELDPEFDEYLKEMGLSLYGLKEYERANSILDRAIILNPNDPESQRYKGSTLYQLNKYDEAVKCFENALVLRPSYAEAAKEKELALKRISELSQVIPATKPINKTVGIYGNRKAIIIGINEYQDQNIPMLPGAKNDAKEIHQRLKDANIGGFEIQSYLVGENATSKEIRRAINDAFLKADPYDLVLLYFSGHVLVDGYNEAYLVPYDMLLEQPFINGINMRELGRIASYSMNKGSVVMILDCCYNGIVTRDEKSSLSPIGRNFEDHLKMSGENRVILASSQTDQKAREIEISDLDNTDPHVHGIFTHHLLEGIDGRASDEKTGIINLDGLCKYVQNQMKRDREGVLLFSVTEGRNLEGIEIAVVLDKWAKNKNELISLIAESVDKQDQITTLFVTAKKLLDLEKIDPNSTQIPEFKSAITKSLQTYSGKLTEWLVDNEGDIRLQIEKISPGLYSSMFDLEKYLVYDKFVNIDSIQLRRLSALCDIINSKTSEDVFIRRLTPHKTSTTSRM